MSASLIANLERLLAAGQDSSMLRMGLGSAYSGAGQFDLAIAHLQQAVRLSPEYSAAWKALGKALVSAERRQDAIDAYQEGIRIAETRGDLQAAREMRVFLKRLLPSPAEPPVP